MNRRQRITVFAGTLVVALMLLFPPMKGWRSGYGFAFNKRFTYIAELDQHAGKPSPFDGWVYWRLNTERLMLQILIVVVLTSGTTVLLGGKRD